MPECGYTTEYICVIVLYFNYYTHITLFILILQFTAYFHEIHISYCYGFCLENNVTRRYAGKKL